MRLFGDVVQEAGTDAEGPAAHRDLRRSAGGDFLARMGEQVATGTETAQKMALMGALSLYLDFINLFLMLLRLFGRRD